MRINIENIEKPTEKIPTIFTYSDNSKKRLFGNTLSADIYEQFKQSNNGMVVGECVLSIGSKIFNGLNTLSVNEYNKKFDSRNNCNAIIETSTNALCVACNNTIIPNSVETIKTAAFFKNNSTNTINVPPSVENIEYNAFAECTAKIKFKKLYSTYTNKFFLVSSTSSASITYTLEFNIYDIPDDFLLSNVLSKGVNKNTITYNISTNNTDLQNDALALKDDYTIVNVTIVPYEETSMTYKTNNHDVINPDRSKLPDIDDIIYDTGKNIGKILFFAEPTFIGNGAFKTCTTLTNIKIPASIKTIESDVFTGISANIVLHAVYNTYNKLYELTDNSATYNVSFNLSSLPLNYNISSLFNTGNENNTITLNLYLDMQTLKNQADELIDNYTIVNTYHLDGIQWGKKTDIKPASDEIWYISHDNLKYNILATHIARSNNFEYGIYKIKCYESFQNLPNVSLGDKNILSLYIPENVQINSGSISVGNFPTHFVVGINSVIYPGSKVLPHLYFNGLTSEFDANIDESYITNNKCRFVNVNCIDGDVNIINQESDEIIYFYSRQHELKITPLSHTFSNGKGIIKLNEGQLIDGIIDSKGFQLSQDFYSQYFTVIIPNGVTSIGCIGDIFVGSIGSDNPYNGFIQIIVPESVNEITSKLFQPANDLEGLMNVTVFLKFERRTGSIIGINNSIPPQGTYNEETGEWKSSKGTITYYIITDSIDIVHDYKLIDGNNPFIIFKYCHLNMIPWDF